LIFPVVMFVGKAGSGKDTAANLLREMTPGSGVVTLAAPLKDFAGLVFGFAHIVLWGPSEKRNALLSASDYDQCRENFNRYAGDFCKEHDINLGVLESWFSNITDSLQPPKTARFILQTLGTEVGRYCNPNAWIDYGLKTAERMLAGSSVAPGVSLVTITDGRFRNEVLAVKKLGGLVLKIVDPDSGNTGSHASEVELDGIPDFWYDSVISNRKSLGLSNLRHLVHCAVQPSEPYQTLKHPYIPPRISKK